MVVTTTQIWQRLTEKAITLHPTMVLLCVTGSLRDGIVLWELQEQKCQQRVSQHTGVVQHGQVGWMVLILQREMVKFPGKSALVIVLTVAKATKLFWWKTVDPTLSTNWDHQNLAIRATVGLIKRGAKSEKKKWKIFKFLCKYICCFIFVLISTSPVSVQDS